VPPIIVAAGAALADGKRRTIVARLDGPIRATVDLTVEPLAHTRSRRDMTFVRRPPGWYSPPVHVTATADARPRIRRADAAIPTPTVPGHLDAVAAHLDEVVGKRSVGFVWVNPTAEHVQHHLQGL
jgi:hypothetical protein